MQTTEAKAAQLAKTVCGLLMQACFGTTRAKGGIWVEVAPRKVGPRASEAAGA